MIHFKFEKGREMTLQTKQIVKKLIEDHSIE